MIIFLDVMTRIYIALENNIKRDIKFENKQ